LSQGIFYLPVRDRSLDVPRKLVINLRAFPSTAAARKVLSPPVRVVCPPTIGTSYALEAATIPSQISAESASRGVQRILLDGANFRFMGACGQRRCLRRQGQAGIYVGNLKPKLVGRLREQAGLFGAGGKIQ
jgi:hypothetical protein